MADIPDFETYKLNKSTEPPSFEDYKKVKADPLQEEVTITAHKHGGIRRPSPIIITRDQAEHTFREFPGKQIPEVLPGIGGALGGMSSGIPGAAAGAGFMSALGTLLQNEAPNYFGKVPEKSGGELATKFLTDAGINGVLEGGSKLAGYGVKKLAANILSSRAVAPFSTTVKTAREADRVGNLASQADYLIHTPQPGTEMGNEQISNLFSKGYSPSTGSLNASKILDELEYNGSKYNYIDPDTKERAIQFLTEAKDSKPFIDSKDNPTVLRYLKGKIALGVGSAIGHSVGGPPGAAVAGGTILLGGEAIKRAVADPEINRLMLQAFKTGSKSPEASVLNKVITNSLRGLTVTFQGNDGSEEPARIGSDGQVQLLPPHR